MGSHEYVKTIYGERPEQNWCDNGRIFDALVKIEDDFIKMIPDFELMWDGDHGKINFAKHWIKVNLVKKWQNILRRVGRVQEHTSLKNERLAKCCRKKSLSRLGRKGEQRSCLCRRGTVLYAFASNTGILTLLRCDTYTIYQACTNGSIRSLKLQSSLR